MNKIRLNKFISDSGYCSRREADVYIEQGRVTVNRQDCLEKGTLILSTDRVEVDGELIKTAARKVYIALNKPAGVTCTTDREDKTNIVDFVSHKERIFPIGRLDKLSQGLIFMTSDGDIVNKILRAGNSHEKEYVVTVDKPITDDFIERMSQGVRIEAGVKTLPCKVWRESDTRFRIVLTQGLNRQIRRMCETLRYNVKKLQRVRIMNITIKGIEEGSWRYFTEAELDELNRIIETSVGTEEASMVNVVPAPNSRKPMVGASRGKGAKSQSSGRSSESAKLSTGKRAAGAGSSSKSGKFPKTGSGASSSYSQYRKAGRSKSRSK